ncbi:unnamed protein product [Ixodes hexagonus]
MPDFSLLKFRPKKSPSSPQILVNFCIVSRLSAVSRISSAYISPCRAWFILFPPFMCVRSKPTLDSSNIFSISLRYIIKSKGDNGQPCLSPLFIPAERRPPLSAVEQVGSFIAIEDKEGGKELPSMCIHRSQGQKTCFYPNR